MSSRRVWEERIGRELETGLVLEGRQTLRLVVALQQALDSAGAASRPRAVDQLISYLLPNYYCTLDPELAGCALQTPTQTTDTKSATVGQLRPRDVEIEAGVSHELICLTIVSPSSNLLISGSHETKGAASPSFCTSPEPLVFGPSLFFTASDITPLHFVP